MPLKYEPVFVNDEKCPCGGRLDQLGWCEYDYGCPVQNPADDFCDSVDDPDYDSDYGYGYEGWA